MWLKLPAMHAVLPIDLNSAGGSRRKRCPLLMHFVLQEYQRAPLRLLSLTRCAIAAGHACIAVAAAVKDCTHPENRRIVHGTPLTSVTGMVF